MQACRYGSTDVETRAFAAVLPQLRSRFADAYLMSAAASGYGASAHVARFAFAQRGRSLTDSRVNLFDRRYAAQRSAMIRSFDFQSRAHLVVLDIKYLALFPHRAR